MFILKNPTLSKVKLFIIHNNLLYFVLFVYSGFIVPLENKRYSIHRLQFFGEAIVIVRFLMYVYNDMSKVEALFKIYRNC